MKRFSKVLLACLLVVCVTSQTGFNVHANGVTEVVAVEAVYHTHLGVAGQTSANGCYTVPQTKPETVYKGGAYNSEAYEGNYYVAYLNVGTVVGLRCGTKMKETLVLVQLFRY